MGKVKITARIYGPRLAARAVAFPAEAHRLLEGTMEDISDFSQKVFVENAPRRSGRLREGVVATPTKAGVSIRVSAVDPDTGFDYVGVTRFGHKVRRIRPIQGRTPTGKRRFRSGYLRFESRGRLWILRSVRGYKPKRDWVVTPRVESRTYARRRFKEFEKELARRW